MDSIKWMVKGFLGGYSSPVMDGDRLYQVDNSANLFAFDVETGRQLWKQNLGVIQKASSVFADGKIYVGTESGKFFIIRPHADRCEVSQRSRVAAQRSGPELAKDSRADRGRLRRRARPDLFRIERPPLCHRPQDRPDANPGSR